jgi:hypothetical protein
MLKHALVRLHPPELVDATGGPRVGHCEKVGIERQAHLLKLDSERHFGRTPKIVVSVVVEVTTLARPPGAVKLVNTLRNGEKKYYGVK